MNAPQAVQYQIGQPLHGGFFAGLIMINGIKHGLIVAPKAEGELKSAWHDDDELNVEGATSYDDGFANTNAMAKSGSPLAKQIRALNIGGHDDWYLPAQDELEERCGGWYTARDISTELQPMLRFGMVIMVGKDESVYPPRGLYVAATPNDERHPMDIDKLKQVVSHLPGPNEAPVPLTRVYDRCDFLESITTTALALNQLYHLGVAERAPSAIGIQWKQTGKPLPEMLDNSASEPMAEESTAEGQSAENNSTAAVATVTALSDDGNEEVPRTLQILRYIEQNPKVSLGAIKKATGIDAPKGYINSYADKGLVIFEGERGNITAELKTGTTADEIYNNHRQINPAKPKVVRGPDSKPKSTNKTLISAVKEATKTALDTKEEYEIPAFLTKPQKRLDLEESPAEPESKYGKFRIAYASDGSLLIFGLQFQTIELNKEQTQILFEFVGPQLNLVE